MTTPRTRSRRLRLPALLLLLLGAGVALAQATEEATAPTITDRLIPYGPERERLTLAYLEAHYGAALAASVEMVPRVIVLHWTAGGSAEGAWNTFAPERLRGRPEIADAGAVNVSAHFIVDRDGSITRLMPETRVGRHVIGLNHLAIGVENVGDGSTYPMTEAQIAADAALVRDLKGRFPTITHLIGHHEYRKMEGHPYFAERDPAYRTGKSDPGDAFMTAVRARVADLGLEGPPTP